LRISANRKKIDPLLLF